MTVKKIMSRSRPAAISRFTSEIRQPTKITPRRLFAICIVVFSLGVGVRLLHWQNNWLTIDNTMNKTAARYQEEAQFLTEGEFRSFIRGRSAEPDTGMLIHTPGYPILVAAVHAVTRNSNVALRLVHVAFGAAAAVLVLFIALELLPTGVAVLASLFAAISPQLSYYSLVLLPDSVIGLTILLGIYLLVRARKRPNQWLIVAVGVCIGLSCWLRANVMLLAPFLCLAILFLFPRDKWLRYSALLILAAVLTVMPITIRNTLVFKSFIPLTLGTGVNLMEGIADYDPGKRFGMEQHDHRLAEQEAVLYNRPDYAEDLYRPDGIMRERLRVNRARDVISANKLWFMGVMAQRAGKMLTYERVAVVSAEPSVTNSLDTTKAELAWRASPSDLPTNPKGAMVMRLTAQPAGGPWATFKVQRDSDYLLTVPVRPVEGRTVINLIRPDNGTLASATIPDSLDPAAPKIGDLSVLRVPFVNASADQLNLVVTKPGTDSSNGNTIEVGAIELHRLGSASSLWTKYPRMLVKNLQKFFTTGWMLPLTLLGAGLLALARRFDALAIACAGPIYFMMTHAPMHLELRYILPIHYFWALFVATSLYFISVSGWKLLRIVKRSPRRP